MARKQQRTVLSTVVATISGSGTASSLFWNGTPAPASVSSTQTYSYSFSSFLSGSLASGATITSVGVALPTGWSINSAARTLNYDGTGSAATTTGIVLRATNGATTADSPIFSLTVVSSGANPGSGTVTTFLLQSAALPSTYPFTVGMGFAKGDVPVSLVTNLSNYQVKIKRTWNDGSVKHAIISGRVTYTSSDTDGAGGYIKTITVSRGAYTEGTALTHANIVAAAPTALVTCQGYGTVSLSTLLLSSPFRTWISGPEMVECHYRGDVGGGSLLQVWFHVRLYADGRLWIRAIVENGYLDNGAGAVATNADATYVPTVTIGGTVVYNNGGASLTHCRNTRWMAEGWIGGNPQITPKHNTAYLQSTKLVPNYYKANPSATTLNSLSATYSPMGFAQMNAFKLQNNAAFNPSIALLPHWNACYLGSNADARAYRSVIANASAYNSFGIVWRDATTKDIIKPNSFANWSIYGAGQGGDRLISLSNGSTWEINHHYNEAYLAYLLTGDYWHYETMLLQTSLLYAIRGSSTTGVTVHGNGTSRKIVQELRGTAWSMRSMSTTCALMPDARLVAGTIETEYRELLANNAAYWKSLIDTPGINPLGFLYDYSQTGFVDGGYGPGRTAIWMHCWWVQSMGMGSDMEPLASMTTYNAVRDWLYKIPVGLFGDSTGFWYSYATAYSVTAAAANTTLAPTDPGWFTTWAQVYTATFSTSTGGAAALPKQNTLASGGDPGNVDPAARALTTIGSGGPTDASGRWGYILPAIAYAVDHAAPGAQAAWDRIVNSVTGTGAMANYGTSFANSLGGTMFNDLPQGGVFPRNYSDVPSWVPAAGTFADISLNTLNSVKPSGWPTSDIAGPFINWSSAVYARDYSTLGAFTVYGSGHLASPSAPLWAGVNNFNLSTRLWEMSNVPIVPMSEGGFTYDQYGEAVEAPVTGHISVPHTYDGLVYQPASLGGGSKGSLWQNFFPGYRTTNPAHRFDLSSANGAPTRPCLIPMGGSSSNYPMMALDEGRGGYWALSNNGIGPLSFVKFSDNSVTPYSGLGYNDYGDHSLIYIPAPYDCLVGMGRTDATNLRLWTVWVCPFVANVPQGFTQVTPSGTPPTDSRAGGCWSTILNCIVSFEGWNSDTGAPSTRVHKLTPPSSGSLTSGTWTWTNETLISAGGAVATFPINPNNGLMDFNGTWSKFQEVPALRCFIYCTGISLPVQAWRLTGM